MAWARVYSFYTTLDSIMRSPMNHLQSAHWYADDTQIYLSLVLRTTEIPRLAAVETYTCISVVCAWLIQNLLRKGGLTHVVGFVF